MCVCSKYVHVCVSTHECVLGVHVWYVVPCIVYYRYMCTYYVGIYVLLCVYGCVPGLCVWWVMCELYKKHMYRAHAFSRVGLRGH